MHHFTMVALTSAELYVTERPLKLHMRALMRSLFETNMSP